MKKYTREDVVRLVEEEDVEFIRLQFTDSFRQHSITEVIN